MPLGTVPYILGFTKFCKMLFLTNEEANAAEIAILSARDTARPGFQAWPSWVGGEVEFVKKGI